MRCWLSKVPPPKRTDCPLHGTPNHMPAGWNAKHFLFSLNIGLLSAIFHSSWWELLPFISHIVDFRCDTKLPCNFLQVLVKFSLEIEKTTVVTTTITHKIEEGRFLRELHKTVSREIGYSMTNVLCWLFMRIYSIMNDSAMSLIVRLTPQKLSSCSHDREE